MAESKRLAAHRAAALSAGEPAEEIPPVKTPPAPAEEDEENPTTPVKDKPMPTEEEMKAAVVAAETKARDEGTKAANDRMNLVFASEHYVGRETVAAKMLGRNMSAEDIIATLADMPKAAGPTALTEEQRIAAAETAGREEMKDQLALTGNSNIVATGGKGGEKKPDTKAEADAVWGKAYGLKEGVK